MDAWRSKRAVRALGWCAAWCVGAGAMAQGSFELLDLPPGGRHGVPTAMRGSTVVGTTQLADGRVLATRWSIDHATTRVEILGQTPWTPSGVLADGSIVGTLSTAGTQRVVRWNDTGSLIELPPPLAGASASCAGVGSDGSTRFGVVFLGAPGAVSPWAYVAPSSGPRLITGPGVGSTSVRAVAPDGTIAVGVASFFESPERAPGPRAFLWTLARGIVDLGLPTRSDGGAIASSVAVGIDDDGLVVAGSAWGAGGRGGFAWRRSPLSGLVPLASPRNAIDARASCISGNARVIAGAWTSVDAGVVRSRACVWTTRTGPLDLAQELERRGVDVPAGWTLTGVVAIDAQGERLLGSATGPNENNAATTTQATKPFVAYLPALGCLADCDGDGGVSAEDITAFLAALDNGSGLADIDDGSGTGTPDGGVTIEDLLLFLRCVEQGC